MKRFLIPSLLILTLTLAACSATPHRILGSKTQKNSATAHLPKGHLAQMAKNAPRTEIPALC